MTTIGVLAIGSLYWGNGCRRRWRDERLDCGKQECVTVPIRYGRRSSSWEHAYTMVVSPSLSDLEEWGTAIAIPYRSGDLIDEAERLWDVEANKETQDCISASWGRVALLENPDRGLPEELLAKWTDRIAEERQSERYKPPKCMMDGEVGGTVDLKSGLLKIDWPSTTDGQPLGWNALLVAVTDPKGPKRDCCLYPSSQEIAKALENQKGASSKKRTSGMLFLDESTTRDHHISGR